VLLRDGAAELPEYVPRLEQLVEALRRESLPLEIQAALMQHYERVGEFAKAEDALFAMIETEPSHDGLGEFGLQFYERLLRQPDATLEAGNLPRDEVQASMAELKARLDRSAGAATPEASPS
jgi:hypothetical protein